ncbi:Thymidylate kinase [Nymphon striatum]|nr:Thymidylate kinase [Nymphon striatum]
MNKISLNKGVFITFEGGEGAGKSSQIKLLDDKLNKLDYKTILTREPGGTAGAEAIRHVILSGSAEKLGADVEAMLFSAARSDHVDKGMKRANARRSKDTVPDRFEKEDMQAQEMRREAFQNIAEKEPERCKLIDASGSEKQVAKRIWEVVEPLLERKSAKNG